MVFLVSILTSVFGFQGDAEKMELISPIFQCRVDIPATCDLKIRLDMDRDTSNQIMSEKKYKEVILKFSTNRVVRDIRLQGNEVCNFNFKMVVIRYVIGHHKR